MSGERFERNGIEKDDGLSVDSWHSVIREGETQYIQLQVKVRFAVDHTLQVMLGGENGEMKLSEKRRKAEIRKAELWLNEARQTMYACGPTQGCEGEKP